MPGVESASTRFWACVSERPGSILPIAAQTVRDDERACKMPAVTMDGVFLGGRQGSFSDKETGQAVNFAHIWLWDAQGQDAIKVSRDREYAGDWASDVGRLKFGDEVQVQVSISANASGVKYRAHRVVKLKAA